MAATEPMPFREELSIGHTSRQFVWLERDSAWAIHGRYAVQAGELLIAGLRIVPSDWTEESDHRPPTYKQIPGRGVTTEVLRSIRIGKIRQAIAARLLWWDRQISRGVADIPPGLRLDLAALALLGLRSTEREAATATTRTGHPRLRDEFLETVARAWVEEAAEGRGALARMVDRFSDQTSSIETVKFWMRKARQAGWLAVPPGGGRGRLLAIPGPRLTAKMDKES